MRSPTACNLCGAVGPVHRHHLTGRLAPGGPYLDVDLVLAVCPRCHGAAGGLHQTLRTLGVEFTPPGVGALAHRLRRVALHAVLLADARRPLVLEPKSARGLAALLWDAASAIDVASSAREGAA